MRQSDNFFFFFFLFSFFSSQDTQQTRKNLTSRRRDGKGKEGMGWKRMERERLQLLASEAHGLLDGDRELVNQILVIGVRREVKTVEAEQG